MTEGVGEGTGKGDTGEGAGLDEEEHAAIRHSAEEELGEQWDDDRVTAFAAWHRSQGLESASPPPADPSWEAVAGRIARTKPRTCIDPYSGPTTLGIDVSKYQGSPDWVKVAASPYKYAISRTGDGKDIDPTFEKNWRGTKEAGLIRGTYHYFRADRGGVFQAELVAKAIEDAGGLDATDLPPAIDIESGTRKRLPNGLNGGSGELLPYDFVGEQCLLFLSKIEELFGAKPLVYTATAFHWWFSQRDVEMAKKFAGYPLWLPSYTSCARMPVDKQGEGMPWKEWTLWQYTSKGEIPGIEGGVDTNRFRGDLAALERFIAGLRG